MSMIEERRFVKKILPKEGNDMKEQTANKLSIYRIALISVFAALVFAANWLYIPIPVAVGSMSRISLGNVFSLLSGLILGPIGGGLASGIGAALFDVTNPAYIASAPFTFVFKFLLAAVCGWIAHAKTAKGENHKRNLVAAVCGSVTYIILYLSKAFIQSMLVGNALNVTLLAVGEKLLTSSVNAVVAVIISVPLSAAIRLALKKSGLMKKLEKE